MAWMGSLFDDMSLGESVISALPKCVYGALVAFARGLKAWKFVLSLFLAAV